MADDIAFLSASRLLALYQDKQLSPVEVIEHTLRRLETYESSINAFVLYDPETALAMARVSEARWQKGERRGSSRRFASGAEGHRAYKRLAAASGLTHD
jgi:aspartyl-tRNA(Asn)/glutamyl-tRNA(Gln) amidotransferase subunit A